MLEGEEKKDTLKIEAELAEDIYEELFNTMAKTVGPWSTKKIFGGGVEQFDASRPVESVRDIVNNMSKMLGAKIAKKITLLAIKTLTNKKQ